MVRYKYYSEFYTSVKIKHNEKNPGFNTGSNLF
jgi:hypothetical protein